MKTYSLAAVGALIAAGATALGMAGFALVEHSANPSIPWSQLLATHALHVAILFVPSYALLALGFSALVARPIRHLEGELYRLATGHFGPVHLDSRIRELQALERGLNLMAQRMAQGVEVKDLQAEGERPAEPPVVREGPPLRPAAPTLRH